MFSTYILVQSEEVTTRERVERKVIYVSHVLSYKRTLIFWNSIKVLGAGSSKQSNQTRIKELRVKEKGIRAKRIGEE